MRIRKELFGGLFALALVCFPLGGPAQVNPRGEVSLSLGGGILKVEYGRPALRGRDVMTMIKPASLWRLGADDPTTLSTDIDLKVGGTLIPKGKYILLARFIEQGKWSLILSHKSAFQYEPSATVAEVEGRVSVTKDPVELVTISLKGRGKEGTFEAAWGIYRFSAPFSTAQ